MTGRPIDVECSKCKVKTKMIEGQQMWHQKCPSRGPRSAAPPYVPVKQEARADG